LTKIEKKHAQKQLEKAKIRYSSLPKGSRKEAKRMKKN
jgi:hypothetical protein